MKANVSKQKLMECIDFFYALKPRSAKLVSSSEVILTVSETLKATGFGTQYDITCQPLLWGSCVLPYKTWTSLATIVCRPMLGGTVTIEVGDGCILIDLIKVKHPGIKITTANKISFDIPIDADKNQIRSFILKSHTIDQLRNSGLWGTYQAIMKEIGANVQKAHRPLLRYGVRLEDLALFLSRAMKVKDQDEFVMALMNEMQKKKSK